MNLKIRPPADVDPPIMARLGEMVRLMKAHMKQESTRISLRVTTTSVLVLNVNVFEFT